MYQQNGSLVVTGGTVEKFVLGEGVGLARIDRGSLPGVDILVFKWADGRQLTVDRRGKYRFVPGTKPKRVPDAEDRIALGCLADSQQVIHWGFLLERRPAKKAEEPARHRPKSAKKKKDVRPRNHLRCR